MKKLSVPILILIFIFVMIILFFLFFPNMHKSSPQYSDENIRDNSIIFPTQTISETLYSSDVVVDEDISLSESSNEILNPPNKNLALSEILVNREWDSTWVDEMVNPKNWPIGDDQFTSAYNRNGTYFITSYNVNDGWRLASTGDVYNGYIEIEFSQSTCKGEDHFGIMFRVPDLHEITNGYLFGITCDGKYSFRIWDRTLGENGSIINLIDWIPSDLINKGNNRKNTLGVLQEDDIISMYINGILVNQIYDDSIKGGHFGVFIGWEQTQELTIGIEKASYWLIDND